MTELMYPRDYSLLGRDARYAEEHHLASATWYQAPIPRKRMKELMKREDFRKNAVVRRSILTSLGECVRP